MEKIAFQNYFNKNTVIKAVGRENIIPVQGKMWVSNHTSSSNFFFKSICNMEQQSPEEESGKANGCLHVWNKNLWVFSEQEPGFSELLSYDIGLYLPTVSLRSNW